MRISDWSSDVCSSDLLKSRYHAQQQPSLNFAREIDSGKAHFLTIVIDKLRNKTFNGPFQRLFGISQRRSAATRRKRIEPVRLLEARSEGPTSELQSLIRLSTAVYALKKKIHKEKLNS